jgi:hypothetical protein
MKTSSGMWRRVGLARTDVSEERVHLQGRKDEREKITVGSWPTGQPLWSSG